MKYKMIGFIAITLLCWTTSAQECSQYYPMVEGSSYEYTVYNKKGKTDGVIAYTVSNVRTDGDSTTATMQMNMKNGKGKEQYTMDYDFTCENGIIKIDYESLFPQQMAAQFGEDIEITMSGTDVELPASLSVGQELKDASVDVAMDMGMMKMDIAVKTINRKIEKKETVTTPAGTFDCFVLYSESVTKMPMGGGNKTFPSRIWLADGVGMVKQVSYNAKGSVDATSELTAFSK
ncbi:MAG: hypothetical protein AAF717_19450 [Bacteroidota bacterium]